MGALLRIPLTLLGHGNEAVGGEIILLNCCKRLQINSTFFQAVTVLSEGKFSHTRIEVGAPGNGGPYLDQVAYLNTRYGKVAREYVRPRNPQTPEQQGHRINVRAVSGRWRTLVLEQQAAWRIAAANKLFVTETGHQVRRNGYNFFVSLNTRRADLDLPQFDLPPPRAGLPSQPGGRVGHY